jgi:prepilin-type N-terminal cleavage/methylation domain-containing protein
MRGYTLIELLVSVLIFSIVFIGIYSLFDKGQWFYLQSERRAHMQENARLVVEQMERDFRMIGAGVPTGENLNNGRTWVPFVFSAGVATIGFTADVDNGTHELARNLGTEDASHIFIGPPPHYYKTMELNGLLVNLPLIVQYNYKNWEDLVAVRLDSDDRAIVTSSAAINPAIFTADRSLVNTLEHVYYRMVDRTGNPDADGVCTDPYPFCTVQRQEARTNNPTITTADPNAWFTIGINVTALQFNYTTAAGKPLSLPADLAKIDKITVLLHCRDRSNRAGQFQDSLLTTEVLIRNRKL